MGRDPSNPPFHSLCPEGSLGDYAPHDFEIRFTEKGSYAYYPFSSGNAHWVPFEVWDIGRTPPFTENDPSDDVQMIPNIFSDGGGECAFAYGELESPFFSEGTNGATDRIYAYYPTTTYADWEAAVKPLVEAHPVGCPTSPAASELINFGRGRPIQRIIFDDATGDPSVTHPGFGTVVRSYTTPNLRSAPILSAPADGATVAPTVALLWWRGVERERRGERAVRVPD